MTDKCFNSGQAGVPKKTAAAGQPGLLNATCFDDAKNQLCEKSEG